MKEVKHLAVAQLTTVESIQSSLGRLYAYERTWRFGIPNVYSRIDSSTSVDQGLTEQNHSDSGNEPDSELHNNMT